MVNVCLLNTGPFTQSVLCGPAASVQPDSLVEMNNPGQDEAGEGGMGRWDLLSRGATLAT